MSQLQVNSLVKQYKNNVAVDHLSFQVPEGCLFGLLGPNGAGKTSTIRMINRITLPDSGTISIGGEPLAAHHTEKIGYLPEERGLYKKMKVGEHLVYLARLRGLKSDAAKVAVARELEKYDMKSWWSKKVEELSKGMQQKVQYVAATLHNPPLMILDEPFSGLDPVNTQVIKEDILSRVDNGSTIIFSTHRMEQVEELCQRIVVVHQGKKILDGAVSAIRNQYKTHSYRVYHQGRADIALDEDVLDVESQDNMLVVHTRPDMEPTLLLRKLLNLGVQVSGFEEVLPSLHEIFIETVSREV